MFRNFFFYPFITDDIFFCQPLSRAAFFPNSWVSRDVIISLGVNSKSMHSHRREIVFHCMC